MLATLPESAQPVDGDLAGRKSYTLRCDGQSTTIGVILNKKTWYLSPVSVLPIDGDGHTIVPGSINRQGGHQLPFGDDPCESWKVAKLVAGWATDNAAG